MKQPTSFKRLTGCLLGSCVIILSGCVNSSYEEPIPLSATEVYQEWVEANMTCSYDMAMSYLSVDSYYKNSKKSLQSNSWFNCKKNEYELVEFTYNEIAVEDTSFQRYAFDYSILNKTIGDTFYFSTEHTFRNESDVWGLIYLEDQRAEISYMLYTPAEFVDYDQVLADLDEYLRLDPYSADFYFYVSECYARLKDVAKTEEYAAKALQYSYYIYAYYYSPLADVYRRTGDYEMALENYHLCVDYSTTGSDSSYYYTCIAYTYGLIGNKDSAAHYEKLANATDYEQTMVNFTYGDLNFEHGFADQAFKHYDYYYGYDRTIPDSTSIYDRKNYVGYLLEKARLTDRNQPYLTYAKEICLTINDGSLVLKNYMEEIDLLLEHSWN